MQGLFRKLNQKQFLGLIAVSASIFLLGAQVYDWLSGEVPCHLCILQRGVLVLLILAAMVARFRWGLNGVYVVIYLGIVIGLRHAYVLIYPQKVTHCLPFELIMDLSGMELISALGSWLGSVGRECSVDISYVTYVLVPFLLMYFIMILYVLKHIQAHRH